MTRYRPELNHVAKLVWLLKDPRRKPLEVICRDVLQFVSIRGDRPTRYFHGFGYRRGSMDPLGYMTIREHRRFQNWLRRQPSAALFEDKRTFESHFSSISEVKVVPIIAKGGGRSLTLKDGTSFTFRSHDDSRRAIGALLNAAALEGGNSVFGKPANSAYGRGAFRISDISDTCVAGVLGQGSSFIFQPSVEQDAQMSSLHPSSLNSLRIFTVRTPRSGLVVTNAWVRIGTGGAIVDNMAQGGIAAEVEMSNGRLVGPGLTPFGSGALIHEHHPDTGVKLPEFEIPHFKEALVMVERAANETQHPLIGWDVAIDQKGPILIEGNHAPDSFGWESAASGYLNHPVLKYVIPELFDEVGINPQWKDRRQA
jgi:hypothetical protein